MQLFPDKVTPHARETFQALASSLKEVLGDLDEYAIADDVTFEQWVEDLGAKGLKVDGNPFSLEGRDTLRFLYQAIPTTPEEARRKKVVVMKGAQLGMTVWEMLALIYMTLKWGRCWVGSFVPDRSLAALKSSKRLMPILRAIPEAYSRLVEEPGPTGKGRQRGEGNVLTRQIGENLLFFLWTSGKVSTESNPMDVVSFDEVQEMLLGDLETTMERLSGSRIGFVLMLSTAKWPDADIDYFYRRGNRHRFHHECRCEAGCVLDDHVYVDRIDCVAWDEEVGDYSYQCPTCKTFIRDNQRGWWEADDPDASYLSVHFPQTLSPTVTPREFLESFQLATDKQNWFNRKAGKPYQDPSQIPITDEVLRRCAEAGRKTGVVWETKGKGYYLGIDQMGAYNVAIVRKRLEDGRSAVVHVEEVRNEDPFARCAQLMDQYGIACAVVETLPNFNDAKRFAARFPGRVFLASYGDLDQDIMVWGDEPKVARSDRRTEEDARTRYTVRLDQYKLMQLAMRRMVDGAMLFPDPDGIVAESLKDGRLQQVSLLRDVVWHHFKKTALVVEDDPETRKKRRRVIKVGIDPHFSYANMLCEAAFARAYGTSTFVYPGAGDGEVEDPVAAVQRALTEHEVPDGTCGACRHREDTGMCGLRHFRVRARDPGCDYFSRG